MPSAEPYCNGDGRQSTSMTSLDVPIAIVGVACRFAGDATGPEKLWDMLASGRNGWAPIPESRFATKGLYHPNGEKIGSINVLGGHFLREDPAVFDAPFFGLSAEVASTLDPQYRLTLEIVFEAMESAGITLSDFQGSDTSVYAGCMVRDYHDTLARDPDTLPRYFMTGNAATMASNRVSHFYDLRGPSMTIDTGCSTTLTALHLACQNLRARESSASIVTGASLMLNPDVFVSMSSIGFLSPDGISYAFDYRANGYGRGEGVAAVILKRLDDAVAAGDPIRAVIRATALNQDGKTPTITTPSREAQEALMRSCYRQAKIDPAETGYVEAHGTGTPTGDPIELQAIVNAVGAAGRSSEEPLLVGSVKTAIGHTEAASGLASVIKVVLGLEKGLVPPNSNFQLLNEKLRLAEQTFKIPTSVVPWPLKGNVRRASINNFGFGGANAHVIIEEYRPNSSRSPMAIADTTVPFTNGVKKNSAHTSVNLLNGTVSQNGTLPTAATSNGVGRGIQTSKVFVLYARDEESCRRRAADLKDFLASAKPRNGDHMLERLAYTLGSRRSAFPWVVACPASSLEGLETALASDKLVPTRTPAQPRIGFVFNGQGAQWHAMGRQLIHDYPVFKESLAAMDVYIKEMGAQWSLLEELCRDEDTTNVLSLEYSLPLCTAIQMALVDLLASWGVHPTAVTGHSSGEVGAAYAAGALDAKSAIAIPYLRGALSAETESIIGQGGMMAIGLRRDKAEAYMARIQNGGVGVACVNSQNSVTASGDIPAIVELEKLLVQDKVFCRRLRINGAFHSHHMAPISEKYMAQLRPLLRPKPGSGSVVFSSSMTGGRLADLEMLATAAYWNDNMLGVVEFEASFREMCILNQSPDPKQPQATQDVDLVLELGPHGSMGGPIQDLLALPQFTGAKISYLNCLVRKQNAVDTMHALVCDLLRRGYPVDLEAVNFPHGKKSEVDVMHDLPAYPWMHNSRFWLEPRVNKAWRERRDPTHDLLGAYQSAGNPFTPTWRNVLRTSDLPWLRDHEVGPSIVYPGAGYICMAIEAAAALARREGHSDEQIAGYRLRDVYFEKALLIPEVEGRETHLTMLPPSEPSSKAGSWREFRVYSVSGDNLWLEHCHGSIQAQLARNDDDSDFVADDAEFATAANRDLKDDAVYTRRVDPVDLWAALRSVGIRHGPSFQNLTKVVSSRSESVVTFSVADLSAASHDSQCLIHPTTLDSVFQAAYTVLPGLGTTLDSAFLPRSIESLSLRQHICNGPGHQFEARLEKGPRSSRSFQTAVAVFDADRSASDAVLEIKGLAYQSLDSSAGRPKHAEPPGVCATVCWGPDVTFASSKGALKHLEHPADTSEIGTMMKLRQAVLYYIQDGMAALTDEDVQNLEWYHAKHYHWMRTQLLLAAEDKLGPGSSQWLGASAADKAALLGEVAAASVNGEMIQRLGPAIPAIFRREVTPLELMLEGGLLYRYYIGALKWDRSTRQVAELVRMLAHKNPRARILEVGGGTGGGTQAILNALGHDGDDGAGALFARYDFTDVSPGFFEAARKRFHPWKSLMTFQKLDVETDPAEQGFECGSYDIVVACQVLHATKSMDKTLGNVHRLLKPGGKLVLIETTQDSLDVFLAFGFLPGWWLSEEPERETSPSLTVPFWDQVLRRNGFTGLDYEMRDCESEEFYSFSVAMSTAKPAPREYASPVALVCGPDAPPAEWLQGLQAGLSAVAGDMPEIVTLGSADTRAKTCIYLGDLGPTNCLADVDVHQFAAIQDMATSSDGLLWITRGGAIDAEKPEASLSHGLLRTLRHEYRGKRYVALDVDPQRLPWTPDTAAAICEVFSAALDVSADSLARDWEFCERGGFIHIPRLFRIKALDEALSAEPIMKPFGDPASPVRVRAAAEPPLADPEPLFASDQDLCDLELPPDHVKIGPQAFGLSSLGAGTQASDASRSGWGATECAGVVVQLGKDAADRGFSVGDRVCGLLFGPWTSTPHTRWSNVAKIPEGTTFETAATASMALVTAYIALHEVAKVQKGESVLVHAAATELGQALVKLCQHAEATVYASVETKQDRQLLVEGLGVPRENIFWGHHASFGATVLERTGGKGVGVVLHSQPAPPLQQSLDCLDAFGRFVELGGVDGECHAQPSAVEFRRGASFHTVDLRVWEARRPEVISRALGHAVHLAVETCSAIPSLETVETYPISRLGQALASIQTGRHVGKTVITVDEDDLVPIQTTLDRAQLKDDASYLVVGGMGGIGRSLCEWMVDRGAKHIIVMSRTARIDSFFAEMQRDIDVRAVSCDVSDKAQLAAALTSCVDMPPIRGVFQGAMTLRDSVFEQMTAEDFKTATMPKVLGSRNLHQQFPGVDFFVMLSSILGVTGAPGQANYTAGGAYQDALARFRRKQGLAAVCVDLSMVQAVGYVAGDSRISDRLYRNGIKMLQEEEMHRILDYAIVHPLGGQIVTGIRPAPGAGGSEAGWLQDNRFAAVRYRGSSSSQAASSGHAPAEATTTKLRGLLAPTATAEEASLCILGELSKEIMRMFGTHEVDESKDLTAHGVDSLVAVEIRNWLVAQAGVELSILDLIQSPSLAHLADVVAARLGYGPEGGADG